MSDTSTNNSNASTQTTTSLQGTARTAGEEPVSVRRSETQIRTTVTAIDITQAVAVVGFFVLYALALVRLGTNIPPVLDNALLVIVTVIVARRLPGQAA